MLSLKSVEPEKKEEVVEYVEVDEESEEEVLQAPQNEQIFKQVEEGLQRPPHPPPTNIIEAEPEHPKKKKRQLSEKQLAHLARMRAKALEKRKKLKAQKEAEKEKKRILKEKKREAKAIKEAQKKAKKEAKKQQVENIQREVQPTPLATPVPTPSKGDEDFAKFFNYMERYDRIKQVRQRQSQRQPPPVKKQPKNKYLGSMIPF